MSAFTLGGWLRDILEGLREGELEKSSIALSALTLCLVTKGIANLNVELADIFRSFTNSENVSQHMTESCVLLSNTNGGKMETVPLSNTNGGKMETLQFIAILMTTLNVILLLQNTCDQVKKFKEINEKLDALLAVEVCTFAEVQDEYSKAAAKRNTTKKQFLADISRLANNLQADLHKWNTKSEKWSCRQSNCVIAGWLACWITIGLMQKLNQSGVLIGWICSLAVVLNSLCQMHVFTWCGCLKDKADRIQEKLLELRNFKEFRFPMFQVLESARNNI